jgi:hypothetical protein
MKLSEYLKIPKGEQLNMEVGNRFRTHNSPDDVKTGSVVGFYEIINITKHGYEVMIMHDRID